jgi:peptidoglycan/LPS O-acetylase OafA/YrhL
MLYFSKLDSLRFFAFFLVFWSHAFVPSFGDLLETPLFKFFDPFFDTGKDGVHIFFVISGFLITYLLIVEENIKGKINIGNFYLRRVLRIWPLYYLIMILGLFILPRVLSSFDFCGSYWMNLSFLNNFNTTQSGECFSPNVLIAWSVAIEEQFYLFWPLVFSLISRNSKLFVSFCLSMYAISSVFTYVNPDPYFHTLGNINYLMIGCLGAHQYHKHREKFDTSFLRSKKILFLMILFLMVILVAGANTKVFFRFNILFLPFIYLYFVMYTIVNNDANYKSIFSTWGKYTYGMYFYHPILIVLVKIVFDKQGWDYQHIGGYHVIVAIISFGLTLAVSILSYQYFEGFFLRLKSKLSVVKTRM